jgi:MYXO-CTERM domain-containing protein
LGDDTDNIDDGSGVIESVSLMFAHDVFVEGINVSALGSSDIGSLTLDTSSPIQFDSSGFVNANGFRLLAGAKMHITHVAGNGFSLDGFSVSEAPVPEPLSMPLALIGLAAVAVRLRRRRAA